MLEQMACKRGHETLAYKRGHEMLPIGDEKICPDSLTVVEHSVLDHSVPEQAVASKQPDIACRSLVIDLACSIQLFAGHCLFALGENGAGLAVQRSEQRVKEQRCTTNAIMPKR